MVDPWVWAVLLILVGLALAAMELFIPSGGILAFLSVSALGGAIVLGFIQGNAVGLGILVSVMVGLPVTAIVAFRVWPRTPIGRRILLQEQSSKDVLPDSPKRQRLKELVGQVGVAKSKMLPSGAITIEGRTIDAFSEGMPIEAGQKVMVIEVHGTQVVVQPVDDETPPIEGGDELSRPIDSVGPDPFGDSTA
jgi:membrane-bound ClpP family serine protease